MQTFLPYSSFIQSAQVLDRQRLGKQRVEAKQIILALENPKYGWQNHPAVNMWRGHTSILALYGFRICEQWRSRGYLDTLLPFFEDRINILPAYPNWLGDESFHRSHRANLLRKNPEHYSKFWTEDITLPYVWPASQ